MLPSWDYVSWGNCKAPAGCPDRLCLQTDWPLRTSHCHILLQTTALLKGTWVLTQGQKPNSKCLKEEKHVSAVTHRTCKTWQCWLQSMAMASEHWPCSDGLLSVLALLSDNIFPL